MKIGKIIAKKRFRYQKEVSFKEEKNKIHDYIKISNY